MAKKADKSPGTGTGASSRDNHESTRQQPGWTKGLKQLYNSVVEEPLPDQFTDLLRQLDEKSR